MTLWGESNYRFSVRFDPAAMAQNENKVKDRVSTAEGNRTWPSSTSDARWPDRNRR
jgi:hypothetical protein